jgi:hypothetical protein
MKIVGAVVLAVVLGAGGPSVQAQTADLTQATCAELMELPENSRAQLAVWLHGYYAGAAQRAVLDVMALENAVAALQQLCERNRSAPLIGSEARALFLGEGTPPQQLVPPSGPNPQAPGRPSSPVPAPAR